MESRGGLVKDVERVAALLPLQLGGKLDPLGLAAGKLRRRLAKSQIAEANLPQHIEGPAHLRLLGKEREGGIDRHSQYGGDVLFAVFYFKGFGVVASAMTAWARCIHTGQEQQFDANKAFALAGLATAFGNIERKASSVVVTGARRLGGREDLANVIEQPCVRREVGPWCASNRLLVDDHQSLDTLHSARDPAAECGHDGPLEFVAFIVDRGEGMAELFCNQFHQDLAHQARLARAGNASHGSEYSQRKIDIEFMDVVATGATQPQPALGRARRSVWHNVVAEQVTAGLRLLYLLELLQRTAVEQMATEFAGAWPDVDNPIRMPDPIDLVFDHEQRIASGFQSVERRQQRLGVRGMKSGGGLVEHIDDAEQIGTHLGCKSQALQFARRKRRGAPLQRKIAKPEVKQNREAAAGGLGDPLHHQRLLRMLRLKLGQSRSGGLRMGTQEVSEPGQRDPGDVGNIEAGKFDRQRFAAKPLAMTERAFGTYHVARYPLLDRRAFSGGKGVQHISPGAGEIAAVTGLLLASDRLSRLVRVIPDVNRDHRLLVGIQDPVAGFFLQFAPRTIDVVAERDQHVAQVAAMPGGRPGGNRALANTFGIIRHHRAFGHLVDPTEPMASGTGSRRRIGRKSFGIEIRLVP